MDILIKYLLIRRVEDLRILASLVWSFEDVCTLIVSY